MYKPNTHIAWSFHGTNWRVGSLLTPLSPCLGLTGLDLVIRDLTKSYSLGWLASFGFGFHTGLEVHQCGSMFVELGSLAGLCHVISLHFICWTVLYGNIALADLISDEEISVVDVP